jgi:hypothetical protein
MESGGSKSAISGVTPDTTKTATALGFPPFECFPRLNYAQRCHTSQGSSRGPQITALADGSQVINGKMSYSTLTRHFRTA